MLFEGKKSADPLELDQSLMDLEDYKFKVGDVLEMFNRKTDTINEMIVEEVLDELIKVRFQNYNQND